MKKKASFRGKEFEIIRCDISKMSAVDHGLTWQEQDQVWLGEVKEQLQAMLAKKYEGRDLTKPLASEIRDSIIDFFNIPDFDTRVEIDPDNPGKVLLNLDAKQRASLISFKL